MKKRVIVLMFLFVFSLAACGDTEDDLEFDDEESLIRVWFYNSDEWEDVRVWAWEIDGDQFFEAWPGPEVIQDEDDPDWFYADLPFEPGDELGVIFNGEGGAVQTSDLTIDDKDSVYITVNNQIFDSKEDAEASID